MPIHIWLTESKAVNILSQKPRDRHASTSTDSFHLTCRTASSYPRSLITLFFKLFLWMLFPAAIHDAAALLVDGYVQIKDEVMAQQGLINKEAPLPKKLEES